MISGYLYPANINDFSDWKYYVLRKLKKLYALYVAINCVFIAATNLFVKINVYSNSTDFLSDTANALYPQQLTEFMGLYSFTKACIKSMVLLGSSQMGGATWFIAELFIIQAFHSSVELSTRTFFKGRIFAHVENTLLIIMLLLATILSKNTYNTIIMVLKRLPYTYVCFLLGRILSRYKDRLTYRWWFFIISAFVLALINRVEEIELSIGSIGNPVLFIMASCLGWLLLVSIANFFYFFSGKRNIFDSIGIAMRYVGQNTLSILFR